ncbi:YihY/virulence factor BrkB family protein [Halobacteriales archaeon SW_5_68_122]|nr:MAG: YihY/virulence factor BrkB family protein [Halobacteriales archaeon SW_5_68_122]
MTAVARRGQVSMLAASLAYFGLSSLLPFVFLAAALLASAGSDAWTSGATEAAVAVLGSTAAELILSADVRLPSAVVGVALLLWGTLRLYRSTDRAFTAVYGERKSASVLARFRDATVVFATNAVAVVLVCGVGVWLPNSGAVRTGVAPLLLLGVLVAVFLPIFYVFPTPSVTLREVLPGTVLAATAWVAVSIGFRFYIGVAQASTYGALGALLLASTWLYVGAAAMLLGAAYNAVLADRVDPDDEWVPTDYM